MNINQATYRRIPLQNVAVKVVIAISNQLWSDGLKALLVGRGYKVDVFVKDGDFSAYDQDSALNGSSEQNVWILDMKTLLNMIPTSIRETIRDSTILIADAQPSRKSRTYLADVAAVISTESSFQELDFAVRAVSQGNRYFDQRLSHFRLEEFNRVHPSLTVRQMQVLRMVADGMSSRKIASELLLSRRTIENHRARILERLGVSSAAEMIDMAHDRDWI